MRPGWSWIGAVFMVICIALLGSEDAQPISTLR